MKANTPSERLINGIIKENPTFVLMLGMCPTLAVTTSAVNGIGMGLTTTTVLAASNLLISLLRKFIPDGVRTVSYTHLDVYKRQDQEIEFVITEFNPRRRRIIGNRKQLLLAEKAEKQKELMERIHAGDTVTGVVKNVTDFGAFIDLGGADGLLHISEMSWGRVENPKKVFTAVSYTHLPAAGAGAVKVTASVPGKVLKIVASAGQAVKAGDSIVILESMKMEIPVVAPQDGTVAVSYTHLVDETAEKKILSHTLLEKEFDRTLMVETNRNPHHYYPSDCIVPRMDYAKVIHCMFPEITAKNIFSSLKMMKFLTNAMVYNNSGKRRLLAAIVTRIAGRKRSAAVLEYFMEKDPVPGSEAPVKELHRYFDQEEMCIRDRCISVRLI